MQTIISEALHILEEFVGILDQAYWEISTLNGKDVIYDCISALHHELSELNKLSVQDLDLPYEPTSMEFRKLAHRLTAFRQQIDQYTMRSETREQLEHAISSCLTLVSPQKNS